MGNGIVYLLMVMNMISVSGWMYIGLKNMNKHSYVYGIGCLIYGLYFMCVDFSQYIIYVIAQAPVNNIITFVWVMISILAAIGTGVFIWFEAKHPDRPKHLLILNEYR